MKLKPVLGVLLKTVLPLVVGLAVLVVLIGWMAGVFGRKIEAGQGEVSARKLPEGTPTDIVHPVVQTYFEEAVGTLKAASRTEISARVMAPINTIDVRAGELVEQGAELIRLDDRALRTKRSQMEASLTAAEAAVKRTQGDFDRAAELARKRAISRAEYDQAAEALKVAEANLKHAREALQEAEVMISYTTILAPKPGMIVDRLAEEGDMARPGEPLLVLYDPKSLRLEVPVMENLAVNLNVGDKLQVYVEARDRWVETTVDEIVPQAQAASRSFLVKVRLPRSDDLFEGMFGRLRIPVGQRRHLCLVTAAIEKVGQLEFVDVVGPGNVLERRYIKTGRLGRPGRVEVLSGLKAKERVVLKPSGAAARTD